MTGWKRRPPYPPGGPLWSFAAVLLLIAVMGLLFYVGAVIVL